MIMKASDADGDYQFTAIGIDSRKIPLVKYDWKYKEVSHEKWQRFDKYFHERAGEIISGTAGVKVLITGKSNDFSKLSESWKAAYNPMER